MPCPQCGQPVTIGAPVCSTCGLRLSPQASGGREPGFDDGMPGWLRQIQGGPGGQMPQQPPQYPQQQAPQQYNANSLMNGDALPGWLRDAGANAGPPSQYAPPPPAPDPYGGYNQQRMPQQPQWPQQQPPVDPRDPRQPRLPNGAAVASNALFDETALPDWLRQTGGHGGEAQATLQQIPPYAAPGRMPMNGNQQPYPQGAGNGYAGAPPNPQSAFPSLDQVSAPSRGYGAPAMPPSPQGGGYPAWQGGGPQPVDPSQRGGSGMAAQSLIDETALPNWLRSQPQLPQGRQEQQALPPAAPGWDAVQQWPPAASPQQMGAGSFVDDGALPGWLRTQNGGQAAPNAQYSPPGMTPDQRPSQYSAAERPGGSPPNILPRYGGEPQGEPAGLFSASDLIDPQALPGWVQRTGESQASFSSSGGWSAQPTSRQSKVEANEGGPRGATRQQPAYDDRDFSPRALDRQGDVYAPTGESQIPQGELPPWLQRGPQGGAAGRGSAYPGEDPRRAGRGDPRPYQQEDQYDDAWDGGSYQDQQYPGGADPRAQGQYADPYGDGYDVDPRRGQAYGRGRDQGYGDLEDDYGDTGYDDAQGDWPPQSDGRGGDGKRGGWRKLFGRR